MDTAIARAITLAQLNPTDASAAVNAVQHLLRAGLPIDPVLLEHDEALTAVASHNVRSGLQINPFWLENSAVVDNLLSAFGPAALLGSVAHQPPWAFPARFAGATFDVDTTNDRYLHDPGGIPPIRPPNTMLPAAISLALMLLEQRRSCEMEKPKTRSKTVNVYGNRWVKHTNSTRLFRIFLVARRKGQRISRNDHSVEIECFSRHSKHYLVRGRICKYNGIRGVDGKYSFGGMNILWQGASHQFNGFDNETRALRFMDSWIKSNCGPSGLCLDAQNQWPNTTPGYPEHYNMLDLKKHEFV